MITLDLTAEQLDWLTDALDFAYGQDAAVDMTSEQFGELYNHLLETAASYENVA